jgi:hypothetical protein
MTAYEKAPRISMEGIDFYQCPDPVFFLPTSEFAHDRNTGEIYIPAIIDEPGHMERAVQDFYRSGLMKLFSSQLNGYNGIFLNPIMTFWLRFSEGC